MTTDPAAPPAARPGDSPALLPGPTDAASGDEAPGPVCTAVEDWVTGHFLPTFRRTLGGEYRWCRHWWQHGEAVSRLTSLWHAWEVLRLQPGTGIGTWYRDHLDHQLPILMGARGPFFQCTKTAHREPREAAAPPSRTRAPRMEGHQRPFDPPEATGRSSGVVTDIRLPYCLVPWRPHQSLGSRW